jgi:pimeloyl-ACP methyl ester carboxylesterase
MKTSVELQSHCGYQVNVVSGNPGGSILIVLLHGFGAGTFSWQPVLEALSRLGEVIAFDRPGFGNTPFPSVALSPNPYGLEGQLDLLHAIIEKNRRGRPVVLIGHSAGGQIAAEFAVRRPGEIDLLVLEDPAILTPGAPEFASAILRNRLFDRLGPWLMKRFARAGDRLLYAAWYDKGKITKEILDAYHAPMARENWRVAFFEFLRAAKKATVQNRLSELDLPVFVISGEHDKVVPVEVTFKVTEQIPGHRIYLVPNAGHIPHEEQPADFVRVVSDFIASRLDVE